VIRAPLSLPGHRRDVGGPYSLRRRSGFRVGIFLLGPDVEGKFSITRPDCALIAPVSGLVPDTMPSGVPEPRQRDIGAPPRETLCGPTPPMAQERVVALEAYNCRQEFSHDPEDHHPRDDVFEQVKKRAEAEGVTVEEAANEAVRLGLSEDRWQKLVKRGRNYSREMAEAATDDDAIQIAVDAVHEGRKGR